MRFAVALVALLSLGSDVWALVAVNHPFTGYGGDFVIKIDPHGTYDSSVSEAGQAGPTQMRVGDRFSAASLTFDQRLQVYGYEWINANNRLRLSVLRETLETNAAARSVTFALRDGNGSYGNADENDPAIISLRAWHKKLNLHEIATGLPGDVAYPMVTQGRLVGVLTLGAKQSGESYSPDESEAIGELAHSVGVALDSFSKRTSNNELLDAIHAIAARLREAHLSS